eukprot:972922-Pleurochrysis_carterae.AAC.1
MDEWRASARAALSDVRRRSLSADAREMVCYPERESPEWAQRMPNERGEGNQNSVGCATFKEREWLRRSRSARHVLRSQDDGDGDHCHIHGQRGKRPHGSAFRGDRWRRRGGATLDHFAVVNGRLVLMRWLRGRRARLRLGVPRPRGGRRCGCLTIGPEMLVVGTLLRALLCQLAHATLGAAAVVAHVIHHNAVAPLVRVTVVAVGPDIHVGLERAHRIVLGFRRARVVIRVEVTASCLALALGSLIEEQHFLILSFELHGSEWGHGNRVW